ncbi:hypothetical protein CR513_21205, partial [Mucuna pruriens]
MKEEMKALEKNSTWEIVDRPKDKRCKSNGTLERYKTCGINYEKTFAPVAKMNMVRIIIFLAAHFDWNLQQFDVKNVFLHGDLEEEAYMEIPLGFYSHNEKNKNQGDHTLFIKHSPDGKITPLLVYVDDMIVIGDDEIEKLTLKEKLATQFEMKELGKLKYFLGVEVNHRIECEESSIIEKSQYQRLMRKLIYLSHTRSDIAYVVSVVSQFMHDHRERHLQAVEMILQYLKASPDKGLLFRKKSTLSMEIYTDADYVGSVVDKRSTSGYCMFLGGNLGICERLWMEIILNDLKLKYERPIKLFCDNSSTISIAHNLVQHDMTKHIEIDKHFIKEKLDNGLIITPHVLTGL